MKMTDPGSIRIPEQEGHRFASLSGMRLCAVLYTDESNEALVDKFDALILEAVQRNNRLTAEGLAEQVGLSPDACRKRLKRLRNDGIIEADIALLAPDRVGRGLVIIVEVALEKERKADLETFKRRMLEAPEVMQCYYVTGVADFFLLLTARDMAEYEAFTELHFFKEANVSHFTTSVVMDRVKTGFFVPVALDDSLSR